MTDYYLATTAIEESWEKTKKTLFLGEWCRRFRNREVWSKMDATVHSYHWDNRHKYYKDYLYLDMLYEHKLTHLSECLAEIHGTSNNIRYWRIIIGPWLRYFIDALFDRFESIKSIKQDYIIKNTLILNYQLGEWIPDSFTDFYIQFRGDEWNHIVYSECIKMMGLPFTNSPGILKKEDKTNNSIFRSVIFNSISTLNKLIPSFLNRVVIVSPYIKFWRTFKLQIKL